MNTAKDAEALVNRLKDAGTSKPDIIRQLAYFCLGWPYVYAAAGEMCTPEWRKNRMGYSDTKYAEAIRAACPVLNGSKTQEIGSDKLIKVSSCSGCKWEGCWCFDCRGFTRKMLEQAGITLAGGGATSQWGTASNWVAKGEIKDMPLGLVCCIFKRKGEKMSHTGLYLGKWIKDRFLNAETGIERISEGPAIIHCSTTVKEDVLPGTPAWTHWAIPAGLYSIEELRRAGIKVDESKNIPTLRKGSNGEAVEELQAILNAKYGANLEIDGKFGSATEKAVKAFQSSHGLTADGVVGPKTWAALGISIPGTDTDSKSNAEIIWNKLYSVIQNPYGVAGLMGNLQAESGLSPINLQNTGNKALNMSDAEYTAAVDDESYTAEKFVSDGFGFGVAQWTYRTRKAALLKFAREKGQSIGDLNTQIDFLLSELLGNYSSVWYALLNASSIREASDAVLLKFERPKNVSEENQIRRAELGQPFFDRYGVSNAVQSEPIREPATNQKTALKATYAALKTAEDCIRKLLNELEGNTDGNE